MYKCKLFLNNDFLNLNYFNLKNQNLIIFFGESSLKRKDFKSLIFSLEYFKNRGIIFETKINVVSRFVGRINLANVIPSFLNYNSLNLKKNKFNYLIGVDLSNFNFNKLNNFIVYQGSIFFDNNYENLNMLLPSSNHLEIKNFYII